MTVEVMVRTGQPVALLLAGVWRGYDGRSCDVPRGSLHDHHRGNFCIDNDGPSALWLR